jgi:GNAT superfamily N-acetyltransferase
MLDSRQDVLVQPFRPEDQGGAKGLILAGLVEHWGWLDTTKNPDLDDIATWYADAVFLVARQGDELVGTGALVAEADGVGRIVRMSVATEIRRRGIGSLILKNLIGLARAAGYCRLVLDTSRGFRCIDSKDGETHFVFDLK